MHDLHLHRKAIGPVTAASAAEVLASIAKQSGPVTTASAGEVPAYIVKQSGLVTVALAAESQPPSQSSRGRLLLRRPRSPGLHCKAVGDNGLGRPRTKLPPTWTGACLRRGL
jgi:hypothetical protein